MTPYAIGINRLSCIRQSLVDLRCSAGLLILLITLKSTQIALAQSDDVTIITGELPPYAYFQEGQVEGVATLIVEALMRRTGSQPLTILPWARALEHSTHGKTVTFPLARLPYRENQYQWIGPILQDNLVFVILASHPHDYQDLESLKSLSVVVNRGAPTEKRLLDEGFEKVEVSASEISNARMLLNHRFDAWYTTQLMMKHALKTLGEEEQQVKIAYTDLNIDMYLVASLDVPKEQVQIWQNELDEMKKNGAYARILQQFSLVQD